MNIIVDNKSVEVDPNARNLLEALKAVNIEIPNLCYLSEASIVGACRMCLVEIDGRELQPACVIKPREGITLRTNTPQLYEIRRGIIELILASHNRDCPTCERNGSCKLQMYADIFGIRNIRYDTKVRDSKLDDSSPIIRDNSKCMLCGDCVRVCNDIQKVGAIDFTHRSHETLVGTSFNRKLIEGECVFCGQCVAYCPTGALSIRNDLNKLYEALKDKNKVVVGMVAPAVRAAIHEEFPGAQLDVFSINKIASFLKGIGFSRVFDVTFGADLVAYEEAMEFLNRVENNKNLPHLTSCCPGWVKFMEEFYPSYLNNLSTVKSPQQAMGKLIKKVLSKELNVKEDDIYVVSFMPCSAKKYESSRKEMKDDVNLVLTTAELSQLIKANGLDFNTIDPEPLDKPFGLYSGSGLSFGRTGGVLESVVRILNKKLKLNKITKKFISKGILQTDIVIDENTTITALNVFGLGNAKLVMDQLKNGTLNATVVEVMACHYGCIGGGGQPYPNDSEKRQERLKNLNNMCKINNIASPDENPYLDPIYQQYLKEPLSHESHNLIHTHYHPRRRVKESDINILPLSVEEKVIVKFCLGTSCYMKGSYQLLAQFLESIRPESWADKVEVVGTFCTEKCDKSPNVIVGEKILHNANIDKVKEAVKVMIDGK